MALFASLATEGIRVDDTYELPFCLRLIVGKGRQIDRVTIDRLTEFTYKLKQYMYTITELKDLKIELVGKEGVSVDVALIWNKVYVYGRSEGSQVYHLSSDKSLVTLYENGANQDDNSYPWRCGSYHFEVVYDGRSYFGGFTIVPKNVTTAQLEHIREYINSYVLGLTEDDLSYKKTVATLGDADRYSYWRYFQWYAQQERLILQALNLIEQHSRIQRKRTYVVQKEPRRIDRHSVRLQHSFKGGIYQDVRFINRRLDEDWDTAANRLVKYRVNKIVRYMTSATVFLREVITNHQEERDHLLADHDDLQNDMTVIRNQKNTTESSLMRLRHALLGKEKKLEKVEETIDSLKQLAERISTYKKSLVATISAPFWGAVAAVPAKNDTSASVGWARASAGSGYELFNRLWEQSERLFNEVNDMQAMPFPVFKPTYLLYEYYVFFVLIEAFSEVGFTPPEGNLSEQLSNFYSHGRLEEGTKVTVIKENKRIDVVYNEYIQPNEKLALEKDSYFYSMSEHREPDIRVDQYCQVGAEWVYSSSIIFEVKYSPLYNIWNPPGKGETAAMEQLAGYTSINYISRAGNYNHHPIKKIICVYPGAEQKDIVFPFSYGFMLQLYPATDRGAEGDIVGRKELIAELEAWLAA